MLQYSSYYIGFFDYDMSYIVALFMYLLFTTPDYMLLDALTPVRIGNLSDPSESWNDYEDKPGLPEELLNKVDSIVDLVYL